MIVYIKEAIYYNAIFKWHTNATAVNVSEATLQEHKLLTPIQ